MMNLSVLLIIITAGVILIAFGKLYSNLLFKINSLKKENLKGLNQLKEIELQQKEEDVFFVNVLSHPRCN